VRPSDRQAFALLVVGLVASVGLVGGAHRWGLCFIAALAVLSPAPYLRSRRVLVARHPLLVFIAITLGLTLLQLLPLPAVLVRALAPYTFEVVAANRALLGIDAPGWLPLSLDPVATFLELVELMAYGCFAYVALRLAERSRVRRLLLAAVAAVTVVVALTALGHGLLGAKRLFGVYALEFGGPKYIAPLINPNHTASLLAFGCCVCLGLVAATRGGWRVMWFAATALNLGTCLTVASRGATLALAIGVVVTAGLLLWRRWRGLGPDDPGPQAASLHVALPAGVVAACGLTLVAYFSASGIADQLYGTRLDELTRPRSKFSAWAASYDVIAAQPLVGVGRGAFDAAFPAFHPASAFNRYAFVENEYLQAVLDWGVPGFLLIGAALAWLLVAVGHRWRADAANVGVLGGLVAVGAHSLVDFGLELPGLATPVLLAVAALVPGRTRELRAGQRARLLVPRLTVVATGATLVVIAALPAARTLSEDRKQLAALASAPAAERRAAAAAALRSHPADYFAAAQLAQAALEGGLPNAPAYLNRALLLHPTHTGLHHLAARLMFGKGYRRQALVEYATAIRYSLDPRPLLAEMLSRYPRTEDAVRGLPDDANEPLVVARHTVKLGRPDVALAYLRRFVRLNPGRVTEALALADLAGDLDPAVSRWALEVGFDAGKDASIGIRLARAQLARGESVEAKRTLARSAALMSTADQRFEHALVTSELASLSGEPQKALEILRNLVEHSGISRNRLRGLHLRLAELERQLDNAHAADWHAAQAEALAEP
jgi:tetratricopeptide (TPR) repeat protein